MGNARACSPVTLKCPQEVCVCPASWLCLWKYTRIEQVQHKVVYDGRVEKPADFIINLMDSQTARILISRAYTMLEKSNSHQSKPQQADLNVHATLSAICYTQYSFTVWAQVASISKQSGL